MNIRVNIAYLDCKERSARAIHSDIVAMLEPNIMKYSTITHHLSEAKFPLSTEEASDGDDRKRIDDGDETVLSALSGSPLASGGQLS
jgi:hypothetical protein